MPCPLRPQTTKFLCCVVRKPLFSRSMLIKHFLSHTSEQGMRSLRRDSERCQAAFVVLQLHSVPDSTQAVFQEWFEEA